HEYTSVGSIYWDTDDINPDYYTISQYKKDGNNIYQSTFWSVGPNSWTSDVDVLLDLQSAGLDVVGEYRFDLIAYDNAAYTGTGTSNESDVSSIFVTVVDTTAPAITSFLPAHNDIIANNGTMTVTASANDPSGISLMEIYLGGTTVNERIATANGDTITSNPIDLSSYADNDTINIYVKAVDGENPLNEQWATHTIIVDDKIDPGFVSLVPTNSSNVEGSVSIQGIISSDPSGIEYIKIYIDAIIKAQINDNVTTLSHNWDTTSYTEGGHSITLEWMDSAGNVDSVTYNVNVVDITAPSASASDFLIDNTNNAFPFDITVTIPIQLDSITDTNGIWKVELYWDEAPIDGNYTLIDSTTFNTINDDPVTYVTAFDTIDIQSFKEGVGRLELKIFDNSLANKTYSLWRDLTIVDILAPNTPTLTGISTDSGNPTAISTTQLFIGDSTDVNGIDNIQVLISSLSFEYNTNTEISNGLSDNPDGDSSTLAFNWNSTAFAEGTYTITVIAVDPTGNSSSNSYYIEVIDITGPSLISWSSPTENLNITSSANIEFTARDPSGLNHLKVIFDGIQTNFPCGGAITCSISATDYVIEASDYHEGTYPLQIIAVDDSALLNETPFNRTVTIVDIESTISWISPGISGSDISGNPVFDVDASDASGIKRIELWIFELSTLFPVHTSTSSNLTYSDWDTTLFPTLNNPYFVSILVVDDFDNYTWSHHEYNVVDVTPPTLSNIVYGTLPEPSSFTGSVLLTANASDLNGLTSIDVLLDNIVIYSDTSSPTDLSYSWDTTTYSKGTHELTIRATDASGNNYIVPKTLTVVDTTAPSITISSPTNGGSTQSPNTISITHNGTDTQSTIVQTQVYVDGVWYSTLNGNSGTTYWYSSYAEYTIGSHTITVYKTDSEGNTSNSSISHTITSPPQDVYISTPSSGATVSGNVTITGATTFFI
ncbi:hypothetical protein LCGC14_1708480, partial [marine sediment metagenome]